MPDMTAGLQFALMAPLCAAAIWCDLRMLRIPNWIVCLTLLAFLVTLPLGISTSEVFMRAIVTAAVFTVGLIGFSLRLVGGGDVKFLSALMLLLPSQTVAVFFGLFSVSLLAGIVFTQLIRLGYSSSTSPWAFLRSTSHFPMGLSIGIAGLCLPVATAFYS